MSPWPCVSCTYLVGIYSEIWNAIEQAIELKQLGKNLSIVEYFVGVQPNRSAVKGHFDLLCVPFAFQMHLKLWVAHHLYLIQSKYSRKRLWYRGHIRMTPVQHFIHIYSDYWYVTYIMFSTLHSFYVYYKISTNKLDIKHHKLCFSIFVFAPMCICNIPHVVFTV